MSTRRLLYVGAVLFVAAVIGRLVAESF